MAMTLAEMKVGMSDKVAEQVVDIFLRESEILQLLPFDDTVSPSGGSTLTYSYMQNLLPSVASFRGINEEYTANQATIVRKTADLKIFGGKFSMDRVLRQAEGKYNNMEYQMTQKILAAISLFHYTLINGDSTTNTKEFDGLDKMLAGMSTEFNTDMSLDISTAAKLKENADQFYELLQNLIKETDADALLMNTAMISKVQTLARILGYKTDSEEAFGRQVTVMDNVRLMDLKNHYTVSSGTAVANSVVKSGISRTFGESASATTVTGLTDIYAVKFDVNDGFHGASLSGTSAVTSYLPDFNEPGAVKDGEIEMIAAVILKNTQHAGVLRNIKIV